METVRSAEELRRAVGAWRRRGRKVGFVPTMGALHAGHLALVRRALESADRVVVSVFVNPTQFGPEEDLERYPRDPEGDAAQLAAAGCHLLFLPDTETIYPEGDATTVSVAGPANGLEGSFRPGHFQGVATVVLKLFHLVEPDLAVFGEKDAQQLAVVRRLVRDLHLRVEIVSHPIVRAADGLALSSRNAYLTSEERRAASVLHRALDAAQAAIESGEREADRLRALLREVLASEPGARVDYAEVVDAASFEPLETLRGTFVLPLAVRFGSTRLLDNRFFTLAADEDSTRPRADRP